MYIHALDALASTRLMAATDTYTYNLKTLESTRVVAAAITHIYTPQTFEVTRLVAATTFSTPVNATHDAMPTTHIVSIHIWREFWRLQVLSSHRTETVHHQLLQLIQSVCAVHRGGHEVSAVIPGVEVGYCCSDIDAIFGWGYHESVGIACNFPTAVSDRVGLCCSRIV